MGVFLRKKKLSALLKLRNMLLLLPPSTTEQLETSGQKRAAMGMQQP
jgi:hypothetical protein